MTYDEQRRRLVDYLEHKAEIGDWHGVSDAANDLRVLEANQARECAEVASRSEAPNRFFKTDDVFFDVGYAWLVASVAVEHMDNGDAVYRAYAKRVKETPA